MLCLTTGRVCVCSDVSFSRLPPPLPSSLTPLMRTNAYCSTIPHSAPFHSACGGRASCLASCTNQASIKSAATAALRRVASRLVASHRIASHCAPWRNAPAAASPPECSTQGAPKDYATQILEVFLSLPTSAPGLGSPLPTSAPGLGSPLPTSAPGLGCSPLPTSALGLDSRLTAATPAPNDVACLLI